jgi:hypothetical protein
MFKVCIPKKGGQGGEMNNNREVLQDGFTHIMQSERGIYDYKYWPILEIV